MNEPTPPAAAPSDDNVTRPSADRERPASGGPAGVRPGAGRPRRGRRPADYIVPAWLALAAVVAAAHPAIPDAGWLMVHLVVLGAVTHSALVWSEHFAVTLLHLPAPGVGALRNRWVLAAGASLVLLGVPTDQWWVALAGAVVVSLAVLWHAASLVRALRRALPGRFRTTIHYYIAAACWLPVGATFGVTLASGLREGWHARFLVAHTLTMLLGWLGLTVAGTLVTFWPTVLRTRMDPRAETLARQALPVLLLSLVLIDAGVLAGVMGATALGLAGYAAGIMWWGRALLTPLLKRPPQEFASASIGASLVWFMIALFATAGVVVTSRSAGSVTAAYRDLAAVWVVGFALQLLLGALSYLLPSVLGGGPSVVRAGNAWFDRWAGGRLTIVNLGLPLWLVPSLPSAVRVNVSVVLLAALAAFLPLMLKGLRASVAERRRIATGGEPTPLTAGHGTPASGIAGGTRVSALTRLGMMAGITALAVALASGLIADRALTGTSSGQAGAASGKTVTAQVSAAGMRFTPNRIEASPGDRVVIELTNDDPDMTHDLMIAGAKTGRLAPGQSETLDLGVVTTSTQGWCTIVGHRQAGMTLDLVVGSAASATAMPTSVKGDAGMGGMPGMNHASTMAPDTPLSQTVDPAVPAAAATTKHQITMRASEVPLEVAPGVWQRRWTFNGASVGPTLRGKVGDVFEVTLVNDGTMGHSLDFHAGDVAPDAPMRTIAPGETLTYTFTAKRSGVWLYHCATMPMSAHIAAGMHGAVIIDPPGGLPKVDREYVVVSSEVYLAGQAATAAQAQDLDMEAVTAKKPSYVVFNGIANQYDQRQFAARVGERVRFWVVDAGPNEPVSFHIVGGQFDTLFAEGAYRLKNGRDAFGTITGGAQALALQPAEGGFVELSFTEAGHYPVVSHVMSDAEHGAHGVVNVTP